MSELHNRARLNGIEPRIAQPKPLAIANQLRPMSFSPSEIRFDWKFETTYFDFARHQQATLVISGPYESNKYGLIPTPD